jgi:hypothetical protein
MHRHTQTDSQSVHLFFQASTLGRRAEIANTQINQVQAFRTTTDGVHTARGEGAKHWAAYPLLVQPMHDPSPYPAPDPCR